MPDEFKDLATLAIFLKKVAYCREYGRSIEWVSKLCIFVYAFVFHKRV
jgi:hypothetical protein